MPSGVSASPHLAQVHTAFLPHSGDGKLSARPPRATCCGLTTQSPGKACAALGHSLCGREYPPPEVHALCGRRRLHQGTYRCCDSISRARTQQHHGSGCQHQRRHQHQRPQTPAPPALRQQPSMVEASRQVQTAGSTGWRVAPPALACKRAARPL